ncbi:MAG: shikimate dehydrogenase [Betaproteobacteria bacterium RIFCSPLOWO2_02_FULL_66_14]|nr:MAG: shikimate dehydrogenase [Betaproteobacteria bacterium RIFCSPLOWO2_02_FULL_66_14]
MTDRYAVIGHPVAHSRSPWIHTRFALATGEDIEYLRLEAPPDGFERAVNAFRASGGLGLNVTLPFKEEACRYAAALSERARVARAVNTLKFDGARAYGDNTDGAGLIRDLVVNLFCTIEGAAVLLLGAGGAARGVLAPLLQAGPARLMIANRTPERARALVAEFAPFGRGARFGALALDALQGEAFDLVINATSAGLGGTPLELPGSFFRRGLLAYDMMYGRDTAFLAQARAAGAIAKDGAGMLVEQAAESFYLWRGVRPDTAAILAALRAS